jgi:hypothetical protein
MDVGELRIGLGCFRREFDRLLVALGEQGRPSSTTTTSGVKSRLLEKAEKHERLAVGEPDQEGTAASLRAAEATSRRGAVKNFGVQAQIEELRREREQSADLMELVREKCHQAITEAEARRKTRKPTYRAPIPCAYAKASAPRSTITAASGVQGTGRLGRDMDGTTVSGQ